jgi:hypothetical protein
MRRYPGELRKDATKREQLLCPKAGLGLPGVMPYGDSRSYLMWKLLVKIR